VFPAQAFTVEWIHAQRRTLGNCDPGILEKCVHALTLLGHLAESGLPFLFKGGTSLLLHLPKPSRLSRDIDIVCGQPAAEVDAVVARIGESTPFMRWAEDQRGARGLPQRRHFKFFYRSALPGNTETEVLLDVVEESHETHEVVSLPIRTSFLRPEREVLVRIPTIESLLGDKLTAFAPSTTGVPLRKADGSEADVQQVAKQLFDVGALFDVANDFVVVDKVHAAVCALEAEYRDSRPTRQQALDDTWQACLAMTATKPAICANYPDGPLLHAGLNRMRGHLIEPKYVEGPVARQKLAAKAAVLVAHMRSGAMFDFAVDRYTGSSTQLDAVRAATLNGTDLAWLDKMKTVNPEAFHYWHRAVTAKLSQGR
jgi:hypothetical protein